VGNASYTAATPIELALVTAAGSDSAAGTEVVGGSYARQTITWDAAASGQIANSAIISFGNMPTTTVVGVEIYDSSGPARRLAYGPLNSSKALTSGDTLQFAAGSITLALG
jgi:hypothetical protein